MNNTQIVPTHNFETARTSESYVYLQFNQNYHHKSISPQVIYKRWWLPTQISNFRKARAIMESFKTIKSGGHNTHVNSLPAMLLLRHKSWVFCAINYRTGCHRLSQFQPEYTWLNTKNKFHFLISFIFFYFIVINIILLDVLHDVKKNDKTAMQHKIHKKLYCLEYVFQKISNKLLLLISGSQRKC